MRHASSVILRHLVPEGAPQESAFEIATSTVEAALAVGDMLVRVVCFSADPYLRGRIKTGVAPRVLEGYVSGVVLDSNGGPLPQGALFGASLPFSTVQVVRAGTFVWDLSPYCTADTLSLGVGVLGMPGATAYGGLFDVLRV